MRKRCIICLLLSVLSSCHQGTVNDGSVSVPTDSLSTGDIAFRKGNGLIGKAVTSVETESLYSHVGIVVRAGNEWMVVHAVPGEPDSPSDIERVKCETLAGFFSASRATHGEIIHIESVDSSCAAAVRNKALRMYEDRVPFDRKFDLSDTNSVYCTEFVYLCYQSGGLDLTEGRRTRISAPFFNSVCILPEDIYRYNHKRTIYKY